MNQRRNNNNLKTLEKLIDNLVSEVLINEESTLLKEDDVIYKAFVEPFKDVIDTAAHGLKSVGTSAVGNSLRVLSNAFMAFIPFISPFEVAKIDKMIDANTNKTLSGIDSEYKDVLQRNMQALQSKDASMFAFFNAPQAFITAKAGMAGINTGLSMLDVLTLGHPRVKSLKNKVSKLTKTNDSTGGFGKTGGGGFGGGYYGDEGGGDYGGFGESVKRLNEQQPSQGFTEEQLIAKVSDVVKKLLQVPDVKQAIEKNPIVQAIQNAKVDALNARIDELSKIQTLEQLKDFVGDEYSNIEKQLPKDIGSSPEAEKTLINSAKKTYKTIYDKYITDNITDTAAGAEQLQVLKQNLEKLV